jgi:hypothetical protein
MREGFEDMAEVKLREVKVAEVGEAPKGSVAAVKKHPGATKKRGARTRKDGAEALRWAADHKVGKNSKRLAEMLTQKALAGDLASAKVLLALAEGKTPIPVKKPVVFGLSLAARLAKEPEWVDPELR